MAGTFEGKRLSWIGTGATIAAVAFTVRPVHASTPVFWSVFLLGCALTMLGVIPRRRPAELSAGHAVARRNLAAECLRVAGALRRFGDEQERLRPRALFAPSAERLARWREETDSRYHKEYRAWCLRVFDDAAEAGVVSSAGRSLVETPSAGQLPELRDLFREAAEQLDRRSP
ncbi:hypothetical protein [Baekduia sp. Peel2402]|uniref:hypothetical protein n=1 Tax=Baekduia sp. Peel2402 TaxID=3458296 RepID=UPI00403E9595